MKFATRVLLATVLVAGAVALPTTSASAGATAGCNDTYTGIFFTPVAGREAMKVNAGFQNCGPSVDYVKVELSYATDGPCRRVSGRSGVDLSYVPSAWFARGTAKVVRCNGDTGAIYLNPNYVRH